ncbi:hypothetical protein [Dactylosporangium sp. NPDC000521]|uniref:hypothetical protein n=1 Tax=Dactylosporangium sp. NPDC000521 TaxID=3363975 RepID=UPI003692319B
MLRVRPVFTGDRGLSSIADGPKYLYATRNALEFVPGEPWVEGKNYDGSSLPRPSEIHEHGPTGVTAVREGITGYFDQVDALPVSDRTEADCWSSDYYATQPSTRPG